MAYSTVSIPGDGSTTLITASFPLGWIDTPDVRIRVSGETDGAGNDVYRTYTRISDSLYQVAGAAAPVGQNYIVERRVTKTGLLVDWEDGDAITEENLNKAQKQAIMIAHEALDAAASTVHTPEGTDGINLIGPYTAGSIPVFNSDGDLVASDADTLADLLNFATEEQGAKADLAMEILQTFALPSIDAFEPITNLAVGQTVVPVPEGYSTITEVHLNGSQLVPLLDYVAYDGVNIVLLSAISEADMPAVLTGTRKTILGGLAGLDARYVKRSDAGRNVGNFLQYEDTDGSGLPTIRTGSRIIFTKDVATAGDPYQFGFIRNTAFTEGSYGTVNANVAMYLEVAAPTPNFQWNLLTATTVKAGASGPGSGEHVNAYFQANKLADCSLWGMCLEFRDNTINPGTGSVGFEFGFFVNGADNNKLRHALDFSFGGYTNDPGDNVISTGIRMGPSFGEPGRMVMRKGFELAGRVYEGIDLSNIMPAFTVAGMGSGGDRAVIVNPNGKMIWRDGGLGNPGADLASFGWVNALQTFALGGVKTYTGAVTPVLAYAILYINGAEWLLPMYQKA